VPPAPDARSLFAFFSPFFVLRQPSALDGCSKCFSFFLVFASAAQGAPRWGVCRFWEGLSIKVSGLSCAVNLTFLQFLPRVKFQASLFFPLVSCLVQPPGRGRPASLFSALFFFFFELSALAVRPVTSPPQRRLPPEDPYPLFFFFPAFLPSTKCFEDPAPRLVFFQEAFVEGPGCF